MHSSHSIACTVEHAQFTQTMSLSSVIYNEVIADERKFKILAVRSRVCETLCVYVCVARDMVSKMEKSSVHDIMCSLCSA